MAFAVLVRGLPVDANGQVNLSIGDVLNVYTLLGGLATAGLFLLYGAVFVALKTSGAIRDDAHRFSVLLSLPVTGLVAAFGLWTQLAYGKDWTWAVLAAAVVAQLAAVALVWRAHLRRLGIHMHGRGRGGRRGPAVRRAVPQPGALDAERAMERDDLQRVVDAVHPEDHDLGDGVLRPADRRLPGMDVLGFPATDLGRTHPGADRSGEASVLSAKDSRAPAPGPATVAGIACAAPLPGRRRGLRSGDLGLRNRLGDRAGERRRRVVTDPSARNLRSWLGPLSILLALWVIRALTHWLQARLGQRGASAVIADLNGQVLAAVTSRQPNELAAQRDAAALVVTRGLDGLRPYFTGYLPTLLLAAILTPATVAVIALYDLKSTVIVVITLPLIPLFMVLIGLATAERSAAALAAMTTLQARLLDLIAGIPTLRALGRAPGPEHRIAELAAAHRRSAMATLRIAFLSALVLELLATSGGGAGRGRRSAFAWCSAR